MKQRIAHCINVLGRFCGKRDIPYLTTEELERKYNFSKVDVMVLFGGSIIYGGDVLANAIKNNIAKKYIIVGGVGHTTEALRIKINKEFPSIGTNGLSEAEIFAKYLKYKYELEVNYLECNSTNCGNNITFLLELLKQNNISFNSILLAQDSTMQHRMEAGLRKYINDNITIINYAVYSAKVIVKNSKLAFEDEILGMWDMDRYITLLMGEIPRLADNEDGYGPRGKGFIAHVDIPNEVEEAFLELKEVYSGMIREANPLYASVN